MEYNGPKQIHLFSVCVILSVQNLMYVWKMVFGNKNAMKHAAIATEKGL